MIFYPRKGKCSTVEFAQLAAQAGKITCRINFDLKIPLRYSLHTDRVVWEFKRLPAMIVPIEFKTTTDLWEFLRGLKWLLDHKTNWRDHLKP